MRLFCVRKVVFFLGNPQIDSFHYTMFHGDAKRGRSFAEDVPYSFGDPYIYPLRVFVNVFRQHGIIQPHGNLLINSKFRDRLGTPANVDLFQCEIEGVCSISYAEGNFDHFDYLAKGVENPQLEFLHQQCGPPSKFGNVPEFLELICPRVEQVVGNKASQTVKIAFPDIQEEAEIPIPWNVERYPMLWHDGYFILKESFYEPIKDLFDPTYFRVQPVT